MRIHKRWRSIRILVGFSALCGAALAIWAYGTLREHRRPPASRLPLDAHYPEMPPDDHHLYINLPLDHSAPDLGEFRGFYILSPGFRREGPVVFFFTDGQMELVDTRPDLDFFDAQLPGLSYVLIGHRGHRPTLFPEVYEGGRTDLERALKLYGSWQRVDDIERVRRDMAGKGLLPSDGRIMIYGASGAGVLAQQYLHRYGTHVSRALLSVTGAPDLAARSRTDYARDFSELEPEAARELGPRALRRGIDPAELAYMLFQLGREGLAGREKQRRLMDALSQGRRSLFWRFWLKPGLNLRLCRFLLSGPAGDAAKVRMFELLGSDLQRRRKTSSQGPHLLYSWTSELLADYLSAGLRPPELGLKRGGFDGEVLVVSARDDVVFSPSIGSAIAAAYRDSRFVEVEGGHRLTDDAAYHAAVRRAFFSRGLRSRELDGLLGSADPRTVRRRPR